MVLKDEVAWIQGQLDDFQSLRRKKQRCCSLRCYQTLNPNELRIHFEDMAWLLQQHRDTQSAVVRSVYFVCLGSNKHAVRMFVPSISQRICQAVWCKLMHVSPRSMGYWNKRDIRSFQPDVHGLTGRDAHNMKDKTPIVKMILEVAQKYGQPVPHRWCFVRPSDDLKELIYRVLPPNFSKRSLHRMYINEVNKRFQQVIERQAHAVSWSTFSKVWADPRLRFVRVSTRERGLCATCLDYRAKLQRNHDTEKLKELTETWYTHLKYAYALRDEYRRVCAEVQLLLVTEADSDRSSVACISFDYARMLKIPYYCMETQGMWHGTRLGMDVPLFGIVDEATIIQVCIFN